MDLLSSATASGLRSRAEALDLLANNIANAQTTGFKADRELYRDYRANEAWDTHTLALDTVGVAPDIDGHWTDFGQGPLQVTGNPLDLALQGGGFFVVEASSGGTAPSGGPGSESSRMMTRDGHFRLSPEGRLETSDGYSVLGVPVDGPAVYGPAAYSAAVSSPAVSSPAVSSPANGALRRAEPITLDPRQPIEIERDGTIRQAGAVAGRILLTEPPNPQVLPKRSGNYFALDPRYLQQPPRQTEVQQGKLEGANFSPAEAAVRLVNVMRQFETLQRALQLGGEMSRRAVEDVARVT